jgi:hypothetical protein
MLKLSGNSVDLLDRIVEIVTHLLQSEILFKNLQQDEVMKIFSDLLESSSWIASLDWDEDRLVRNVDWVMAVEATSGLLKDLTPEEMEIFDAAVAGN